MGDGNSGSRNGVIDDASVSSTARSAIEAGFNTVVLGAAVRGIKEEGVRATFSELQGMGGVLVQEHDWSSALKHVLGPE